MGTKRFRHATLWMLVLFLTNNHILAQDINPPEQVNVLRKILAIASDKRVALGILMSTTRDLCSNVQRAASDDALPASEQIAKLAGLVHYKVIFEEGVVVLAPDHISKRLQTASETKFDRFPTLDGSMSEMGDVLQGWISVRDDRARGFAIDSLAGSDPERYTLPSMQPVSPRSIANRIVTFPARGVWILSEQQATHKKPPKIGLQIYSYRKDLSALERVTCSEGVAR